MIGLHAPLPTNPQVPEGDVSVGQGLAENTLHNFEAENSKAQHARAEFICPESLAYGFEAR